MPSPAPVHRSRVDGCPGVLQVHPAADGGLARVRIPGGWLTGAQLRAVAAFAADGGLDITSRGNLQVRGLVPGAEAALAARLTEAGLLPSVSHERVRNIVASPLSGRDGRGVIDVRPLVRELDRSLCGDPALAALPGRFLFALDDGRGDVAGLDADLTLYGDALLLAGRDSGTRVSPGAAVPAMLAAARRFLAERTDEWRLAELLDGDRRVGSAPPARQEGSPIPAPSLTGEPSTGFIPQRAALWKTGGPIGATRQTDGRIAAGAAPPLGHLTAVHVELLGRYPSLCVTPWRGVLIPDLPDDSVLSELARAGFATDPESPWTRVTACAGRPGCARSRADVRADALNFHSGQRPPESPVHWAGCERACGRPAGPHVLRLATEEGYREE